MTQTRGFSCKYCKIFKNIFLYRVPLEAASIFCKDDDGTTWKFSVKKAILVTSETYRLQNTLYWCFHWIKVRDTDVGGVKPKQLCKGVN